MEWHEREFERLDRQVDKLCKEKKELIEEFIKDLTEYLEKADRYDKMYISDIKKKWEARKDE